MIIIESDENFVKDFYRMNDEEKMRLVQDLKQLAGMNKGPLLFMGPCEKIREEFMKAWNCTPVDIFGDCSKLPRPALNY
ncbi:MAG: hypothetical protein ACP5GO_03690 [Thermoprotei archaeon]|jgi:hypothetical protein